MSLPCSFMKAFGVTGCATRILSRWDLSHMSDIGRVA